MQIEGRENPAKYRGSLEVRYHIFEARIYSDQSRNVKLGPEL